MDILPHVGDIHALLSSCKRAGATSGPLLDLTPFRHAHDRGTRATVRRLFALGG